MGRRQNSRFKHILWLRNVFLSSCLNISWHEEFQYGRMKKQDYATSSFINFEQGNECRQNLFSKKKRILIFRERVGKGYRNWPRAVKYRKIIMKQMFISFFFFNVTPETNFGGTKENQKESKNKSQNQRKNTSGANFFLH